MIDMKINIAVCDDEEIIRPELQAETGNKRK